MHSLDGKEIHRRHNITMHVSGHGVTVPTSVEQSLVVTTLTNAANDDFAYYNTTRITRVYADLTDTLPA